MTKSKIEVNSRPTLDKYFLDIAEATATRSTCLRASVGAVLVIGGHIIGTGFNGAPSGCRHCSDGGCELVDGHCVNTVHAELNAIIFSASDTRGSTLYCTHHPCYNCLKAIINAGIVRIVYLKKYDGGKTFNDLSQKLIQQKGISCEQHVSS